MDWDVILKISNWILIILLIGLGNFLVWVIILTGPAVFNKYMKWKKFNKPEPKKIFLTEKNDNTNVENSDDINTENEDDENDDVDGVDTEE